MWTLAKRPEGLPVPEDFELKPAPQFPDTIPEGEIAVKNIAWSCDPYQRGDMGGRGGREMKIGGLIHGLTVGEVVKSASSKFKEGDIVSLFTGWTETALVPDHLVALIRHREDEPIVPDSYYVGVAGLHGATAMAGIDKIMKVKQGDQVLVSAAAGAVGHIALQLAKIRGAYVVGVAGGTEKCKFVQSLGADAVIDYKNVANSIFPKDAVITESPTTILEAIQICFPKKIDSYFDNVGGETLDAVMRNMNRFCKIAVCGAISGYNATEIPTGPRLIPLIIYTSATLQGFVAYDYLSEWPAFTKELVGYVASKQLTYQEDRVQGFKNLPTAFIDMLKGGNVGKRVVVE